MVVSAVAGGGASSAVVDLYTRRIPNPLTLGIAIAGLMLAAVGSGPLSMTQAVVGFVLGLVLMLPGHVIGATGAGDVKLFAALGTLLGPSRIGFAFAYTAIVGGALAVVVAVYRGRLNETLEGTATLVRTGGSNVAEIEKPSAN